MSALPDLSSDFLADVLTTNDWQADHSAPGVVTAMEPDIVWDMAPWNPKLLNDTLQITCDGCLIKPQLLPVLEESAMYMDGGKQSAFGNLGGSSSSAPVLPVLSSSTASNSGEFREMTRVHYAGLPEVLQCKATIENTKATVHAAGEHPSYFYITLQAYNPLAN